MNNDHFRSASTAARHEIEVSIVTGTLNRLSLLKLCIASIRQNGFSGKMEIIAVDGGSTDGTLKWLARQHDILTIVQPNYKIALPGQAPRKAHSWGEFMNLGFRFAKGKWILMVSDDLVLARGCIQKGLDELEEALRQGQDVGAGALFFRDYPRDLRYHVKKLPQGVVLLNHGFYRKAALEDVQYIDEHDFAFYAADGDLCMRLSAAGHAVVALNDCFANHLAHQPNYRKLFGKRDAIKGAGDMATFEQRWGKLPGEEAMLFREERLEDTFYKNFWLVKPLQCTLSALARSFSRLGLYGRTSS